jgi:preprotein translocase subunit Sec61beta
VRDVGGNKLVDSMGLIRHGLNKFYELNKIKAIKLQMTPILSICLATTIYKYSQTINFISKHRVFLIL